MVRGTGGGLETVVSWKQRENTFQEMGIVIGIIECIISRLICSGFAHETYSFL